LDISNKNLKGKLNLNDFSNLEEFRCFDNNLVNLDLSECINLSRIYCYRNLFTSTFFLTTLPNPEKLTHLDLGSCNFSPQTLDIFATFINLKKLYINGYIYNRFYGSLEPLKNLNKLESIDIGNTDVDDGLEYLSSSLITIRQVGTYVRKNAGSLKIYDQLKPYLDDDGYYYDIRA